MKAGRCRALGRGDFGSVQELVAAIGRFCDGWNQRCQPFTWTKDASRSWAKLSRQAISATTRWAWAAAEMASLAHLVRLANPSRELVVLCSGALDPELVHEQALGVGPALRIRGSSTRRCESRYPSRLPAGLAPANPRRLPLERDASLLRPRVVERVAALLRSLRPPWSGGTRHEILYATRWALLGLPSAFAGFCFPPDVIVLAVRWYLRFGLSYRRRRGSLAERGIEVDHVTVYRWAAAVHAAASWGLLGRAATRSATVGSWTRPIEGRRPVALRLPRRSTSSGRSSTCSSPLGEMPRPPTGSSSRPSGRPRSPPGRGHPPIRRRPTRWSWRLLPAAWHHTERYGNNRVEADHGRLKARLLPARSQAGPQRESRPPGMPWSGNLRRGHYELAVEAPVTRRLLGRVRRARLGDRAANPPSPVSMPLAHQTQRCRRQPGSAPARPCPPSDWPGPPVRITSQACPMRASGFPVVFGRHVVDTAS